MTDGSDANAPPGDADLEDVETPLTRLARRARRWVAALVTLALLVPAGTWAVDEVRFRLSGTDVVETLEDELGEVELADAVMLVRAVGCAPGSDASGSAFVVAAPSGDALITNRHVVENARQVGVRAIDATTAIGVTEVRVSDTADVAVLEISDPDQLPPALATRADPPDEGMDVRLVGFPAAVPTTTVGTVAQVAADRLVLDLTVGGGASGSPVVDRDGRVVGQVFAVTDGGLGIATPVERLHGGIDDARPLDPC